MPSMRLPGICATFDTFCTIATRSSAHRFRATLATGGVKCITLPPRSPNLNAFAERWVRSVKEECLSKLILFGERALQRAVAEFIQHYLAERNHQGKGNVLLFPSSNDQRSNGSAPYTVPRAPRRPTQLLPFTRSMNILAIRARLGRAEAHDLTAGGPPVTVSRAPGSVEPERSISRGASSLAAHSARKGRAPGHSCCAPVAPGYTNDPGADVVRDRQDSSCR